MNEIKEENQQLRFLFKCKFNTSNLYETINGKCSGVYAIRHIPSNEFYVGSSNCILGRLVTHIKSGRFLESNSPEEYEILILEASHDFNKVESLDREAYWCKYYKSFEKGYNESKDGSGFDSNKGRIWVNDGTKNYRIQEHEFEGSGLILGFLDNTIKGRVNITKEGIDKRVTSGELRGYLEDGWEYGKTFISSPLPDGYKGYDPTRHKTRMNNGITEIYITDSWYYYWVSKGYVAGKLVDNYLTVTNGLEEVSIYKHELQDYLSRGYVNKYLVEYHKATECLEYDESLVPEREKRVWMTKFGMDTNIDESRIPEYESDGWVRGRSLIASRSSDGNYKTDRHSVMINNGKEEFTVIHYYLPYWIQKGYSIGFLDSNKCYISNGIVELVTNPLIDLPSGYSKLSLAEFHMDEILSDYEKLK